MVYAPRVSAKDPAFPSFTPWLEGKTATMGMQFTNSPLLGNGVLLWYFDTSLNYDDYKNLRAQAVRALGEPVECNDGEMQDAPGDTWGNPMAYFYKDGKFIMVSYCSWREEDEQSLQERGWGMSPSAIMENHAARIHVHVYDGLTIDPSFLIMY